MQRARELGLAALAELPAPQREIVERRVLHGEDTVSVASRLGISANAAAVRLHRALASLRERCLARDPALAGLLFLVLLCSGRAEAAEPTTSLAAAGAATAPRLGPWVGVGVACLLAVSLGTLRAYLPDESTPAVVATMTTASATIAEHTAIETPTPLAAAWYAAGASLLGEARWDGLAAR